MSTPTSILMILTEIKIIRRKGLIDVTSYDKNINFSFAKEKFTTNLPSCYKFFIFIIGSVTYIPIYIYIYDIFIYMTYIFIDYLRFSWTDLGKGIFI